jgi:hypothetical protein
MIRHLLVSISVLVSLLCANAQQLVINEIDADTTGFDTMEFIELYDGGRGNTSLDNHVLVLFNGADGGSHGAYAVIDLDGLSTDASGFFLAANADVPGIDDRVASNTGLIYNTALQNGEDGVGLYANTSASDISTSSPKTQANENLANLLDAVVYKTGGDRATTLITEFGLTGASLDEAALGDKDTDSAGRIADGAGGLELGAWQIYDTPTPGVKNNPAEEISAFLSQQSISENGGSAILNISLDSPADGDTEINVELSNNSASVDTSELEVPQVIIPDGELSVDVTLNAIDDSWRDFDQVITLDISDPINRFFPASIEITVTDDETGSPEGSGLRLNEVYAAVGLNTDANGDGDTGTSDGSDEFIELVNDSDQPLDISGYTLSDFATVRHTFPTGTVLQPGCAVVVFGSGATEGRSEPFGGALIQNANGANEFGLALNNSGDLVSIRDLNGLEVAGANWGETSTSDGSLTLDPDLNANNTFTVHNVLGAPFSPGKTTTGEPFCQAPGLQLSVIPGTISEDAGIGAVELSITRSGDISSALTVSLSSSDTSEATVSENANFAANEDEISITIDIQDDTAQDGAQTVTFTASAPGYIDGTTTLEVTDNGDAAATVYINEVDYDPEGTDGEGSEFVELFDGGNGNTPLDGFVLVFYNGNAPSDDEYRVIDLSGQQTDGQGFLVVTTPSNGIQNGGGGGDGMALFRGAAARDFNDTNPLTPPAGAVLVDALVYEIGDGVLASGLNYTGPDLTDRNDPGGISRVPDGTGEFQLAPLTRGGSNNQVANPALQLSVVPGTINEDAGAGAVQLKITRSGDISSALTVTLSSNDPTEATVAANATLAADEDEISITIDVQDDTEQDGTQTVTFTASAPGYDDGTTTLQVTDNDDVAAATVYINEVDYDPVGTDGAGSEFVELFDGGAGNTSLDGFVLVFYNGRSRPDPEYRIIDLSGEQTDASGFFVVTTPGNGIQNGSNDGMALYRGAAASDFNDTTPLTPPAGAVLVDSLVYEIGDISMATALNYTGPDLTDSGNPDGISRVPDGTGEFQLAPLTRGSSNNPVTLSAYATWASEFPGIGESGDDDDGDGVPNLLEFGLGLDPFSFNSLPSPTINDSGNLTISVTKGAEAAGDPNTTYFAQSSTDALDWNNSEVRIITDDATTFTAEYTGNSPKALLRIGISLSQ